MTNQVTVYPGGKGFNTIQAAIDSITDVKPGLEYQLECTPGTYNESITLKPGVFVVGKDKQARDTVIHWDATQENWCTVSGASNSGVIACTIVCNTNQNSTEIFAVTACGATDFHLEGCDIIAQNKSGINPLATCTVNLNFWCGGYTPQSTVEISSCNIKNITTGGSGSHQAIGVGPNCTASIYNSSVSTNAGYSDTTAILAYEGGKITVELGDVTCPQGHSSDKNPYYALEVSGSGSSLKAIKCKISGLVSPGVEVVNG